MSRQDKLSFQTQAARSLCLTSQFPPDLLMTLSLSYLGFCLTAPLSEAFYRLSTSNRTFCVTIAFSNFCGSSQHLLCLKFFIGYVYYVCFYCSFYVSLFVVCKNEFLSHLLLISQHVTQCCAWCLLHSRHPATCVKYRSLWIQEHQTLKEVGESWDAAQCRSACLAYTKHWAQYPAPQRKDNKVQRSGWFYRVYGRRCLAS